MSREFTEKVAAANALRTVRLVKRKLEHISDNFMELDLSIVNQVDDAINEIERLEQRLEEARQTTPEEW